MIDNPKMYGSQPGIEEIDAETGEVFLVDGRETQKLITIAAINAKPERATIAEARVLICAIAGEIDGTAELTSPKTGESFTALVGDFEAVVYDDHGEVIRHAKAPMCFLPGGFHESAVAGFNKRQRDPLSPPGAFWLEFYAEPASNPRGYRYVARNRLRYDPETDRLARLRVQAERSRAIEAARNSELQIEHKPQRGQRASA